MLRKTLLISWKRAKTSKINHGCSLLALIRLANEKGYELSYCTSGNAIFVISNIFEAFGLSDYDIDRIYSPKANGRIWQGYDSYLYTAGMNRLMWHPDIKFDNLDLQILPAFKKSKKQGSD